MFALAVFFALEVVAFVVVFVVADIFFADCAVEVFEDAVAALSFLSLNDAFDVVFLAVFAVSTAAALSFLSLKAVAVVVTLVRRRGAVALFLF